MPSPEKQAAMEALCEAIAHRVSGSDAMDWPSQLMHDTSTALLAIIEREKQPEGRVDHAPVSLMTFGPGPPLPGDSLSERVNRAKEAALRSEQLTGEDMATRIGPCATPKPKRETAEGVLREAIEYMLSHESYGRADSPAILRARDALALIRAERERGERALQSEADEGRTIMPTYWDSIREHLDRAEKAEDEKNYAAARKESILAITTVIEKLEQMARSAEIRE